jgi:aspartyl-tRNA(Asn)/glutamyl-tRNA(Gln) amidotransferase subunit C
MAGRIDESQVRHIAKLARLNLSDAEVHLFAGQLAEILNYFRQLEAVNTDGVEPLAHPLPLMNVDREDQPGLSFDTGTALANAPQREGAFFRVPPVLDHGSGA